MMWKQALPVAFAVMMILRDKTTNRCAYGWNATARQILGGEVAPPREAIMLFTDIAVRRQTMLMICYDVQCLMHHGDNVKLGALLHV